MKKYKFKIIQILETEAVVEAENEREAKELIKNDIEENQTMLDPINNLIKNEINLIEEM